MQMGETIDKMRRRMPQPETIRRAGARVARVLRKLSPKHLFGRLDWYIIRKFIGTYIFSIVLIISIALVFDFNENLSKFTKYHAPWRAIVFDYYANFIPYYSNLFSPLFVFIAVIFFTSKLAGNSEIIAMLSSGVSFRRLMRPYMISCVLIASVTFYLNSFVIPHGTVIRQNFESLYRNSKKNTSAENVQLQVGKGTVAYIQHYDDRYKRGYGFSLDKFEGKKLVSHMTAMYLGAVFRYYQFLALEDVLPMLKVLRVKKVSYFDSMGVNHQNAVNSFKGFFKEEEPNLEEITSEEIQELINACTNDRDRLLIAMMAETGLRLGEILGIHYTEDIDFERRTVRVRYRESNTNLARAKNAEYRMALLSNTTFEFLVKYISDNRKSLMNSEYLFTKLTGKNKGEPLDADSVYSMLKRLSKKTDINSHPHQLRHYFAEERRKEGWDLNDIRFALGHKKVETTIKYLGENNERLIEATDQYYSNNEDLYQIADFL